MKSKNYWNYRKYERPFINARKGTFSWRVLRGTASRIKGVGTETSQNDTKTIEVLFQEIYEYDDAERRGSMSIADNIRKPALEFEDIMLQKEQPEFIPTICTLIYSRFKDDEWPWLRTYATRLLDDKYKWFFTEQSYRQSKTILDLPEECPF